MSQKAIDFSVGFEEKPEKPIAITVYAFNEKGELLTSAALINNQVTFALTDDQAKGARIVLAPSPPSDLKKEKPVLSKIERRQAYFPEWKFNPRTRKYTLQPIPKTLLKSWLFCKCQVRGKVVKKISIGTTSQEYPIYMAKVHICEVDPVWLILKRLPEREIFRLRDELIKLVGKPIPIPPEPPILFDTSIIDPSPENVARIKMGVSVNLKTAIINATPRRLTATKKLTIPADTIKAFSSASVETVRTALTGNIELIRPYLCLWTWIWPFFLKCDEIAVVLTDKLGQFSANVWYLCNRDHPDIYFWVEYQIGSAWTPVYHPPIVCHTYWNYPCGTEVVIPITDPRVPWYSEPTPLPGMQIAILSIGHDISISEIKRAPAAEEGLTTSGEPFGGSLEPTVWFGGDIPASGITHYRWSYRRLTKADGTPVADVWHTLDYRVVRHYGEILADGTLTFKPFLLGPDPAIPGAALFKIQPLNPPSNPSAVWSSWAPQIDARENTASAFFRSHLLEGGDAKEAAGKYELKIELFRYNSTTHVLTQSNFTDDGIQLKIPTVNAPFGANIVPTRTVPHDSVAVPDMEDHVIRIGGKIVAFRLVLHIDNNPCEAEIYPIKVSGIPPITWETVGPCGFIRYKTAPPAETLLSFKAAHPNNFARFIFTIAKGSTGYVNTACAPIDPTVAGTALPLVNTTTVNGFTRNASSVYLKQMPVSSLVGTCPDGTAAFGANLSVYPLATDGWTTLWYLSRYGLPTAFALQPKP